MKMTRVSSRACSSNRPLRRRAWPCLQRPATSSILRSRRCSMKRWSASLVWRRRVAGRRAILPRGAREDTAMASAIERGVALPVGQVPGEVVPFLVLQFEIGRHIGAETFIQELGGLPLNLLDALRALQASELLN